MRLPLHHQLDGLLQSSYVWLQQGSIEIGGARRRVRIAIGQFVCAIAIFVGMWLAIYRSPAWCLLSIGGTIGCLLLPSTRLKRFRGSKYYVLLPEPGIDGIEDKSRQEKTTRS
jgi:hypothetical protein